jgi:hypothetical protein
MLTRLLKVFWPFRLARWFPRLKADQSHHHQRIPAWVKAMLTLTWSSLPCEAACALPREQETARERLKVLLAGLPEAVQGLFKREIVDVEVRRTALPVAVLCYLRRSCPAGPVTSIV